MAIEGLIAQKSKLLEELLRLTALMHDKLMSNDSEGFEKSLEQRSAAFRNLEKLDASLKGSATAQDELWLRQLKMIESSDSEIIDLLRGHRNAIQRDRTLLVDEVGLILKTAMMESKGQKIQARG